MTKKKPTVKISVGTISVEMYSTTASACPVCKASVPARKVHRCETKPAEDTDSYLRERCYACGHRLAFASTACPQCNIQFKDGDDPPNWPETCECDRCKEARNAEG